MSRSCTSFLLISAEKVTNRANISKNKAIGKGKFFTKTVDSLGSLKNPVK